VADATATALSGPVSILPAFPAQNKEAFPFIDELFDPTGAIAKRAITHADYRQVGSLS
jgi:hypothetical protein